MCKKLRDFIKCHSGVLVILLAFLLVNGYDAISRFGWQELDLPRVQFWAFQTWVTLRNIVAFTALALVPVFLFGRYSRWIVFPIFIYAIIIEIAAVYSSKVFNADLSSVWLTLVMNTNISEFVQFVKMVCVWEVFVGLCILIVLLMLFFRMLKRVNYPLIGYRNALVGLLFLIPFIVLNMLTMNWHFGLVQMRYTNFVVGSYLSYKNLRGIMRASENRGLPLEVHTSIPLEALPDVIFVWGESATRNNWHLYGYPRHTTPRMDEICNGGGGIVFSDIVGTHPATYEALSLLMTDADFYDKQKGNWTIGAIYRLAGYHTGVVTNQMRANDMKNAMAKLFSGCDRQLSGWTEYGNGRAYDNVLLPMIDKMFAENESPQMIIVHLAGMHYPLHHANPPEENLFSNEYEPDVLKGLKPYDQDRRNRYDNGILYEDKILGGIIDKLAARKRPSCLFFMSDHGESPRSPGWRVYSDTDVYEVPCIIWCSEEYRKLFPEIVTKLEKSKDKPLQPYEMTTGLLELGMIIPPRNAAKSFLDEDFSPCSPRMIDKGRKVYEEKASVSRGK